MKSSEKSPQKKVREMISVKSVGTIPKVSLQQV